MRRPRFRKQATQPSLFPFLAVLICTMGALIVLLVVVMQQAHANAETISEQQLAADKAQAARRVEELEELDWQDDILAVQRDKLLEESQEHRNELSHLEDHFRRLTDRLDRLNEQAERLRQVGATASETNSADLELAALRTQVEEARSELERTRRVADSRPRSFALIPYDGPHGTKRRPIYIECRGDRVTIQPEGIVLLSADFEGHLGPGNPLDAALRAIREHWARLGNVEALGEPYPLLVVRPDGAVSYAAARAAMKSWDDEFGYELIDDEMLLAFPPADETLRATLERTIREARRRQELIKASQPSRFRGGRNAFQAKPYHGGLEPINRGNEHGYGFSSGGPGGSKQSGAQTGGGQQASNANRPSGSSNAGAKNNASAAGGGKSNAAGGGKGNSANASQGNSASASLADGRGKNWALPNAASGSVAFTRSIHVIVLPNRLIIQRERGSVGRPIVVPVRGDTQAAVDEFVSKLWSYMEYWGIAGRGAYWKPVLKIEVAPGAEQRYADLEILLRDSGVALQRITP